MRLGRKNSESADASRRWARFAAPTTRTWVVSLSCRVAGALVIALTNDQ
jgi:hypothetical protein